MKIKSTNSIGFISLMVLLVLSLSWICYGDSNSASKVFDATGPYPEMLGTWVSTGKVTPPVKFTIGNNLLKTLTPGDNHQYFYNGEVICSDLAGNKIAIVKFNESNYIMVSRDIVQDIVYPMVNISASDSGGKMILVRAELKNNQLAGNVSFGKYPKFTYQTPVGSKDVFVKQK